MEFLSQTDVIILSLGTLILGMFILVKGGDWTIDGAVEIARYYGMPPLLVGFTIVAFGTSLPELIASINANLSGAPGLAVGNVVGSNIANILLIAGVSAMISPLIGNLRALRNDLIMVAVASVLWFYALMTMPIGLAVGASAIGLLIGYVILQYQLTKGGVLPVDPVLTQENAAEDKAPKNHMKAVFMVLGGLAGLAIGAELLIRGSVTTARIMNIPDSIIGLTIIAVGTSLPELTTCIIAALKKQSDVIIGNLVGSNVFNLMMILGSMGIIKAYDIQTTEQSMINQDLPIMLGVTALFIITLVIFKKIPRWIGGVFVIGYIGYIGLLVMQSL
jgi:cation:H+ antiporter